MLQNNKIWIAETELSQLPDTFQQQRREFLTEERVWSTSPVPRVAIDRITSRSSIYQVGRTVYAEDCGLWLMVDIPDQQISFFEALLEFLGDSGIGGERSSGYGGFSTERMTAPELLSPDGKARVMTLSRYAPTLDELQSGVLNEDAAYQLVDVGGWMLATGSAAQRRQRVRLIEAGSVLHQSADLSGRLVDVRPIYTAGGAPDHPVYRSGIPLLVGVEA